MREDVSSILPWIGPGIIAYVIIGAVWAFGWFIAPRLAYRGMGRRLFVAQRGSESVVARHRMNPYSAGVWA